MGQPNMEFFLVGLLASVGIIIWGTVLLATYVGLKVSDGTTWNPKVSIAAGRSISPWHHITGNSVNENGGSGSEGDATEYVW